MRQWQALFFNGRFSQTRMLNPDFVTLSSAYGIKAEDVASRGDLPGAIARMLDYDGPYMLNVNIDPADMVMPMTPVGQAVDYIMTNPNDVYNPDQQ